MSTFNRKHYARDTYVDQTTTWGLFLRARVLCADGVLRQTVRLSDTADTFFSVPASVKVGGKEVSGYITFETEEGFSTETDLDRTVVKFVANQYGKNADRLPRGTWKKEAVGVGG